MCTYSETGLDNHSRGEISVRESNPNGPDQLPASILNLQYTGKPTWNSPAPTSCTDRSVASLMDYCLTNEEISVTLGMRGQVKRCSSCESCRLTWTDQLIFQFGFGPIAVMDDVGRAMHQRYLAYLRNEMQALPRLLSQGAQGQSCLPSSKLHPSYSILGRTDFPKVLLVQVQKFATLLA